MKPHFFKARSRLGIVNNPLHQKDNNQGVEKGADYLLDSDFLNNLGGPPVSEFNFPDPDTIKEKTYFDVFEETVKDFFDLIEEELDSNERQIVLGGDHIVSLPSVLCVMDRIDPEDIGYIHIDSHGDINQFSESPSNNFHGMYLRPLFDTFDVDIIDDLVTDKIPTRNLFVIGNLDLDPGEKSFFERKNIKNVNTQNFNKDTYKHFESFINKLSHIHVSLDVDVLTGFSATGIPADKGFSLEQILDFLRIVKNHESYTFDLSEYNPLKDKEGKFKKIAQEIISTIVQ